MRGNTQELDTSQRLGEPDFKFAFDGHHIFNVRFVTAESPEALLSSAALMIIFTIDKSFSTISLYQVAQLSAAVTYIINIDEAIIF